VVLPLYQPSEEAVTGICAATGVPLDGSNWELDVDRVAAAIRPNTKLVLTNFPNSPTGAVLDPTRLAALVSLCRRHGLWLVNDEVYRQTDASGGSDAAFMVADVYERGISINGLSKGFGLPGLRVGWAACRDLRLRDGIVCAKSRLSTCVTTTSEVLAHIALQAEMELVERARRIGTANRRRLEALTARRSDIFFVDRSKNLAFGFPRYIGPGSADAFAESLARDIGVLLLPAALWSSPLGSIRTDHLRVGLGHLRSAHGLELMESFSAVPV
jgi:aspartate/methionine/tyrosine aminotransferase